MRRARIAILHLLLLPLVRSEEPTCENPQENCTPKWTWPRIVDGANPIVANGNVYPPSPLESPHDCLILVTRNQFMRHCPLDTSPQDSSIIHVGTSGRYRGAFSAPGTDRRRMWLLDSPPQYDVLLELDTVTGEIMQELEVEGTVDGHDAVRVGGSVFVVDTRHGHVVEVELPASAEPYRESSMREGAREVKEEGYATIVKRHKGFSRADHANNVAVHPHLLLTNLHGKGAIRRNLDPGQPAPTRLSALNRGIPQEEGRELGEEDGFSSLENVGTWCHGIAFWEDGGRVKLISLDSKEGSIVSVVVSGDREGEREVLWMPDLQHPVLIPPEAVEKKYRNGAKIFSKGLAVQGGVAYFGVSYAREPALRRTIPESLLVAVDLATKKELWVRVVKSNGLINQILTQSFLGWQMKMPWEVAHAQIDTPLPIHFTYHADKVGGTLDKEIAKMQDINVTFTATFPDNRHCLDQTQTTNHMSLQIKQPKMIQSMVGFRNDIDCILKHLCNIDVAPLRDLMLQLGDEGFLTESQLKDGNAVLLRNVMAKFKPGTTAINIVFSSKDANIVYHFPYLRKWFPLLQKTILEPLGIPLNKVLRMFLANMPPDSNIVFHRDTNTWVQRSHRVHVPLVTHDDIFFLTRMRKANEILRVKSAPGHVYEFNNAMPHSVRNLGGSRVHLIVDWVDEPMDQRKKSNAFVVLKPGDVCTQPKGHNGLLCGQPEAEE